MTARATVLASVSRVTPSVLVGSFAHIDIPACTALCAGSAARRGEIAGAIAGLSCDHEDADRVAVGIGDRLPCGVRSPVSPAGRASFRRIGPPCRSRAGPGAMRLAASTGGSVGTGTCVGTRNRSCRPPCRRIVSRQTGHRRPDRGSRGRLRSETGDTLAASSPRRRFRTRQAHPDR